VMKGNSCCPTAELNLNTIRGFCGYLNRPLNGGGFGVALDACQTLAWLAVPDAVNGTSNI